MGKFAPQASPATTSGELDAFLPQVDLKPVLVQNEVHPYYQDTPVVRHIQEATFRSKPGTRWADEVIIVN